MSRARSTRTGASLVRSPFASSDVSTVIFSFCNVWDLGRLCQTNTVLYNDAIAYFQSHKKQLFPMLKYTDVRVDVHLYNGLKVQFKKLYQQHHRTFRQAFEYLEMNRVYHDCKRFYYIVDEWNAYSGYGGYPHVFATYEWSDCSSSSDSDSECSEIDYPY